MIQNSFYLAAFIISQLTHGLVASSTGPLIPYLAANSGRNQTDYSFVFVCRTGGVLLGAIIYKVLQIFNLTSKHYLLLCITSVFVLIGCVSFYFVHIIFAQGIIFSSFSSINCRVMIIAPKQKIFQWFSFVHGAFGLGSVIAPILVSHLKQKCYLVPGILSLCLIPIYFCMNVQQKKNKLSQSNSQEVKREHLSEASNYLTLLMGINFFLTHGLVSLTSGWISSYSTMSAFATKKEASLYATFFWNFFTLFRFISGFIYIKASTKLKRVSQLGVLSLALSIILVLFNHKQAATVSCSILEGISISGIFPFTLTLYSEHNIKITDSQYSNMIISLMVSQAIITAPTGFLMKKICLEMFFYSIMFFNTILFINIRVLVSALENEHELQFIEAEQQIK